MNGIVGNGVGRGGVGDDVLGSVGNGVGRKDGAADGESVSLQIPK